MKGRNKFLLGVLVLVIGSTFLIQPAVSQDGKTVTRFEEIQSVLKNKEITLNFQKQDISQVIDYINNRVNFNLILDKRVLNKLKPSQRKITITIKKLKLNQALKLILKMKNLGAIYDRGTVKVVPETVAEKPVLRFYDIRDLMFELNKFPGPELELKDPDEARASSGGGGGGGGGGFLGGSFSESGGGGGNILRDKNRLQEIIKQNTGDEGAWEASRGVKMKIQNGILIVRQAPDVHKEILKLIDRLRIFR